MTVFVSLNDVVWDSVRVGVLSYEKESDGCERVLLSVTVALGSSDTEYSDADLDVFVSVTSLELVNETVRVTDNSSVEVKEVTFCVREMV